MLARFVGRLILVPLGVLCAAVAVLAVVATLGLERATHAVHGRNVDVDRLVNFAFYAHDLAAAATIMPALLVIIIGEVARIRSWVYYIVGGALALLALPLLARSGQYTGELAHIGAVWQVLATAGFAGGFVYWMIAGRSA